MGNILTTKMSSKDKLQYSFQRYGRKVGCASGMPIFDTLPEAWAFMKKHHIDGVEVEEFFQSAGSKRKGYVYVYLCDGSRLLFKSRKDAEMFIDKYKITGCRIEKYEEERSKMMQLAPAAILVIPLAALAVLAACSVE